MSGAILVVEDEPITQKLIAVNLEQRVESWNTPMEALYGLPRSEAVGKHLAEIFAPSLVAELPSPSEPQATLSLYKFRLPTPSGRERVVNLSLTPLIGKEGRVIGRLVILNDLTERVELEDQLAQAEKLSSIGLLAAGVAHELGNPLNSLNIHLQLMKRQARKIKGRGREELQHSIDICRAEINRLDSIVSQFLRAIRPSCPQLRPENINTIVEEAVRFFSAEIEARDMVVETELNSDLPLLQLDRDQMKQAFYNVIKNSFEAMRRRGILRIRTDRDESHVRVSFIDNGGGMSAEALSHVFEPYYTTKATGTGLGLLIVRRIVREHGGELAIESTEGKGLTLTIRLPLSEQRVRMLEAGDRNSDRTGQD